MSTTGTTQTANAVQFQPYIFLYGRSEEALKFYKDVFGGSYEIMRVKDSPMKGDPSMGGDDRVMHASFTSPAVSFYCSDGHDDKAIDPESGNIALGFSATDAATGERIVAKLSEGGTVKMPLKEAFWGGRFADIVDRFGNEWMITAP